MSRGGASSGSSLGALLSMVADMSQTVSIGLGGEGTTALAREEDQPVRRCRANATVAARRGLLL